MIPDLNRCNQYWGSGPKNNGRFSYWEGHRMLMGLNHRPHTKIGRLRKLTKPKHGWRVA